MFILSRLKDKLVRRQLEVDDRFKVVSSSGKADEASLKQEFLWLHRHNNIREYMFVWVCGVDKKEDEIFLDTVVDPNDPLDDDMPW